MDKFKRDIENFLLNPISKEQNDEYWTVIAKGIILLFKYKYCFNNINEYINEYKKIRSGIIASNNSIEVEDLSDELWAILIQAYPMPNFWESTLEDFKVHNNFKKYFQLIE